jgi:hypothetical protein
VRPDVATASGRLKFLFATVRRPPVWADTLVREAYGNGQSVYYQPDSERKRCVSVAL